METTEDRLLGGRVTLLQPKTGYRAGIDPVLLAAALDAPAGAEACEFGCGPGAALLAAAQRLPGVRFTGIESDADAAALARRNVALNALEDRVAIVEADALEAGGRERFDRVFFNPPFFDDPASLRAPAEEKTAAWMADRPLADWIAAGLAALKPKGALVFIHRADRLGEALAALEGRAGAITVLPVQPRADRPAKRILVRAVKAAKAPLRVLPSLILHDDAGGKYAASAEAVLRGEAALAMTP
ncbi:methyltransferase [Marinicauda salina]|uniref:Methyltransferase n=1 Tax=Marinicauda salina TaxID=2135793 RepID=A0A2U2BV07_9PROT|nr:methyltransferase [Marinicauda salina]